MNIQLQPRTIGNNKGDTPIAKVDLAPFTRLKHANMTRKDAKLRGAGHYHQVMTSSLTICVKLGMSRL